MGAVVEFHCTACSFSSGKLQIGWGKAGRAAFWGGLARCEPCKEIGVADLNFRRTTREDPRCPTCNSVLTLLEGTASTIPCPRCRTPLRHDTVGSWD